MATAQEMQFRVELNEPLVTQTMLGVLQQGDAKANVIRIAVYDGGMHTPAALEGNEVSGYFLREDGERVLLEGSISGNVVSVVLNENCYAISGSYGAFVRLTNTQNGAKRTILRIAGQVESEGDGPIIDPANRIPSIEDVIAQLEKMEQATEKAEEAAENVSGAVEQAQSAASAANNAASTASEAAAGANNATERANNAAATLENAPVPTGTVVTYQAGTSPTTPPAGTWLTNPPAVSQGQYLWTRTVQSFTNGNPVTSYSVARQGMDGSGSVASVDGVSPNSSGNVVLGAVRSVNGSKPDANGNVEVDAGGGTVQSVDGISPNSSGNVLLGAVRSVNGSKPDANGNVEVDAGGGTVQSVNNVQPDAGGNITLTGANVPVSSTDTRKVSEAVTQHDNTIKTLTATEFEALTTQEKAALFASGVRVLAVEGASDSDRLFVLDSSGDAAPVVSANPADVSATLLASAWSAGAQTVTVAGVGAGTNGVAYLAQGVTADQAKAAASAMLHVSAQSEGAVVITAFGTVPAVDIPIVIRMEG